MELSEHLARVIAAKQERDPWDNLTDLRRQMYRRLGEHVALNLPKLSPASTTPQTPSPPSESLGLDALALSRDQAVEVCVAAPVIIDGKTGVLSPESIQRIFKECIKQLGAAA